MRWRLELSDFNLDVSYLTGKENYAADALSRCISLKEIEALKEIHHRLCHPGVTRLLHYCKSHNLPYSVDDIRKVIQSCRPCSELKPKIFYANERDIN